MITVRLFCANGFSTAIMCKKIQEAAKQNGKDFDVIAFPYSECSKEGVVADVILLGPQIRYNLSKVQTMYPDKPVILLDMETYGKMDGAKVYGQIIEVLG